MIKSDKTIVFHPTAQGGIRMKQLFLAGAGWLFLAFGNLSNFMTAGDAEMIWYANLPTASTAEALYGTHQFFTEQWPEDDRSLSFQPADIEGLTASEFSVRLPNNGCSAFVDIIAKIDEETYVNVTPFAEWKSGDETVAYAYNGRITAKGKGTTVITASSAGAEVLIDVEVENEVDLEAEIERLNEEMSR